MSTPSQTLTASARPEAAQHTPGPWRVYHSISGEMRIYGNVEGGPVARIVTANCPDNPQDEANAALIAASPELLECLRDLVEAIWDGRLESQGAEVFTDAARALFAKATQPEASR